MALSFLKSRTSAIKGREEEGLGRATGGPCGLGGKEGQGQKAPPNFVSVKMQNNQKCFGGG